MNTLNDKWLEKASKTSEKKRWIRKNRNQIMNVDSFIMQDARNEYLKLFSPNWAWNGKKDLIIVDCYWKVIRIREINTEEEYRMEILDKNCTFWMYGSLRNEKDFYNITERLFKK